MDFDFECLLLFQKVTQISFSGSGDANCKWSIFRLDVVSIADALIHLAIPSCRARLSVVEFVSSGLQSVGEDRIVQVAGLENLQLCGRYGTGIRRRDAVLEIKPLNARSESAIGRINLDLEFLFRGHG